MTNSPDSNREPEPPTESQPSPASASSRGKILRRILLGTGVIALVSLGGGIAFGWYFVHRKLIPTIEEQVEPIIGRPLDIGNIERVGLSSARVGKSELPPTESDTSYATVEALEINYNLWPLLMQRRVFVQVTAIAPEVYLQENESGEWLEFKINLKPGGKLPVELSRIGIDARNTRIRLTPYSDPKDPPAPVVELAVPELDSAILDDLTRVEFNLGALLDPNGDRPANGSIDLGGTFGLKTGELQGQAAIAALQLGPLAGIIPIAIEDLQGQFDADLDVNLTLKNWQNADLNGIATLDISALKLPPLKLPVTNTNARISFEGSRARLQDFSAELGNIYAEAQGSVDLQTGYELTANLAPLGIAQALQVVEGVESPVPLAGKVLVEAGVTGAIADPKVAATLRTTETVRVDKAVLGAIEANAIYNGTEVELVDLEISTPTGGQVIATGNFNVDTTQFSADLRVNQLNSDLVRPYLPGLPPGIGKLDLSTSVSGSLKKLASPEVSEETAQLIAEPAPLFASEGRLNLELAGGNITIPGWRYEDNIFSGTADVRGVQLQQFAPQIPNNFAPVSGQFRVDFDLADFQPDAIAGEISGLLNLAGGTARVQRLDVQDGNWQAAIALDEIRLAGIVPLSLPPELQGVLNSQLSAAGSLNDLSPEAIAGRGFARIDRLAGGSINVTDIRLGGGTWQTDVAIERFQLAGLAPFLPEQLSVPPELQGVLNSQLSAAGSLSNFSPEAISGRGFARIDRLAGGSVEVTDIRLGRGTWQTDVAIERFQLAGLTPLLPPQLQIASGVVNSNLNASGSLTNFSPESLNASGSLQVDRLGGGSVNVAGIRVSDGNWQTNAIVDNVRLGGVAPALVPPQLQNSIVNSNLRASGSLTDLDPQAILASGSLQVDRVGGGSVNVANIRARQGELQANVAVNSIQLAQVSPQPLPPALRGEASGNLDVGANLSNLSPQGVSASGSLRVDRLAGGFVNVTNVRLEDGDWQARVTARELQVVELAPDLPAPLQAIARATLDVAGNLDDLTPTGIVQSLVASGRAQLDRLAEGSVEISNIRLENGRASAAIAPQNLRLDRLTSALASEPGRANLLDRPTPLSGNIDIGTDAIALLENPSPSLVRAAGELSLPEGISAIAEPFATRFNWQGERLEILAAEAGDLLDASGFIDLNFARQGLDLVREYNLDARIDRLDLARLPFPKVAPPIDGLFSFEGTIAGVGLLEPNLGGNMSLQNFAIAEFAFEQILEGSISANRERGLSLNLAGESDRLQIAVGLADPGSRLPIAPQSLLVRRGETTIAGDRAADNPNVFELRLRDLALAEVKAIAPLPPEYADQPLLGEVNGDFSANLETFDVAGEVSVANPRFSRLQGDSISAEFAYAFEEQKATLREARFEEGESTYILRGEVTLAGKDTSYQASLDVPRGRLQDIFSALQAANLDDLTSSFTAQYGDAEDLLPIREITLSGASLAQKLRVFQRFTAQLKEQQLAQDTSALPPLTEIEGDFSLLAVVNGKGLDLENIDGTFLLQGDTWRWGPLVSETTLALGEVADGILTLLPVSVQNGDSSIVLTGTLSAERQSAQLDLDKIPIAAIRNVVELPEAIGFSGELGATINISGSPENPQARGEIEVANTTLNKESVNSLQGSLLYSQSTLNFSIEGRLKADSEPLSLSGTIPYQLPFATVVPPSDRLQINASLENDGLAIVNVLTNQQFLWKDGEAEIDIEVTGPFNPQDLKIADFTAEGTARFSEATVEAAAIPEPVTDIEGQLTFSLDRLSVESITGEFGGGEIAIAGDLPLFDVGRTVESPLTVSLEELAVDLQNLYKGGVRGEVIVTGAALEPAIGGTVEVFEGQVFLAGAQQQGLLEPGPSIGLHALRLVKGNAKDGEVESPSFDRPFANPSLSQRDRGGTIELPTPGAAEDSQTISSPIPIAFNNLKIELGRNLNVGLPPVANFEAQGDFTLNGSLGMFAPEGTISLTKGIINLGTAQFTLIDGYPQTATFIPAQGLDPTLDVRLSATVVETTRQPTVSDPSQAEIQDTPATDFGAFQTVNVFAQVQGRASRLQANLELSSSPSRSEPEILALLGESAISALSGQGGAVGLAGLAGSALFGSRLQEVVSDALGLSEFRIYSAPVADDPDEEGEEGATSIQLAAEAGVKVTDDITASAIAILTQQQPLQYGIRYRLSDSILLRGATDLSENNRLFLEYETRF